MAKGVRGGKYSGSMEEYLDEVQEVTRQAEEEWIEHPTKYNEYGFEVEDSNNPDVEFTDSYWKQMSKLTKYFDAFQDPDLERDVRNKMYDVGESNEEALTLYSKIEDGDSVTDDEYWAGIHALADMLGVSQKRYTVWDKDMVGWDEKYSSIEQAAMWANEQEDAAYIYDTWTRKKRKLGGKKWMKG